MLGGKYRRLPTRAFGVGAFNKLCWQGEVWHLYIFTPPKENSMNWRCKQLVGLLVFAMALPELVVAQAQTTVNNNPSFPVFNVQSLDGKTVSTASFRKAGRPTIIMYFSPECSHCRAQTEQITGNIKLFNKADWLLVSAYPVDLINKFITDMGLKSFKNISLAYDPNFELGQFFVLDEIPGIFVYNANGELVKQIRKATTAQKIAEAIE